MVTRCQEMPCRFSTAPIGHALPLEHGSLLDMQLDIGVRRQEAGLYDAGVADPRQLLAENRAVGADLSPAPRRRREPPA